MLKYFVHLLVKHLESF